MNDLDTLRSAFPEQPAPTNDVVTAARRRLADQSGTPTSPRSNWFGSHRLGTALTASAAVAITALAVPLLLQGPPPAGDSAPPATGSPTVRQLTASQLLLAAAAHQERAEPSFGRYYRIRTLGSHTMTRIGTGPSSYLLERRNVYEVWTPASARDRAWFGFRDLGARPATAADRERWQRAGSPTRWNLGPTDTADQHDLIITAAPDRGRLDSTEDRHAKRYFFGDRLGLTAAQIQALPTDPAELRGFLLRNNGVEGTRISDESWLFSMATTLLVHAPAPPKLRGAAYRVLAGLPDIRIEGEARDSLGRTGTALTLTERFRDGTVTYRLLVDPSGRLLTERIHGPKSGEQIILAAGWTDEAPRIPSANVN